MQSNYKLYNFLDSFRRIDEILATPQGNFEEVATLPDRSKLTYTNGFYADKCSAVFVDIRDSSSLSNQYTRPRLAKLYRSYISEVVAILNSSVTALEINIVGDGVWAVYNTPMKADIDDLFSHLGRVNSLMKTLNYKLRKAGYEKGDIRAGIGAAYGRALMIKAGYFGSGISEVVYMGEVVNRAAKLAAMGNKNFNPPIYVSGNFHYNLSDESKAFCSQVWGADEYTANIVNTLMNDWYESNCT